MSDPNPPIVVDVRAMMDAIGRSLMRSPIASRLLLRDGCNYIILNVSQLSAADSLVLGAIVQAYASAVRQGALVKLASPSPRFRELLTITKLDRVIETVEQTRARR